MGVTLIAGLFLLAAAYLWTIGAVMLVAPGAISLMRAEPLMYGLELAGPYMALLVGAGWALVGWGLLRLHNWARWAATLLSVWGIAALVPKVSAVAVDFRWSLLSSGLQVALRAAVIWYLLQAPSAIESFTKK